MEKLTVLVMGLDPFHLEHVKHVRDAEHYDFQGLLDVHEVVKPVDYPFEGMLDKAEARAREFPEVAGIITHWDFPASTMLPILCQRLGLHSASIEAVLKCEHKYWSRLEQQAVIPELVPEFCAIDPFAEDPAAQIEIDYPFWLKPVKGFSSHLGFRIDTREDFDRAIPIIRRHIRRIGEPFNVALSYAKLPPEIQKIDGNCCIAEQIIKGKQCGIEGFVHNGRFAVHGAVDTVKDPKLWSFTRYEYPSSWPERIQKRMYQAAEKLMNHIGFDNSPFGVEFFWNEENDDLGILEVNTRISQSHSDQFIKVEGASNHQVAIDVALGREPAFCRDEGKYAVAAKFMLRRYADAIVTRVPNQEEVAAAARSEPDCFIELEVNEGDQLSELRDQDSYSFELANIWLGAQTQDELLDKYRRVAEQLPFEFSDGGRPEEFQFQKVRY